MFLHKCKDISFILQNEYLCIKQDSFGAKILRDDCALNCSNWNNIWKLPYSAMLCSIMKVLFLGQTTIYDSQPRCSPQYKSRLDIIIETKIPGEGFFKKLKITWEERERMSDLSACFSFLPTFLLITMLRFETKSIIKLHLFFHISANFKSSFFWDLQSGHHMMPKTKWKRGLVFGWKPLELMS